MTVLGPLLLSLMMIVPFWLKNSEGTDDRIVYVFDESGKFGSLTGFRDGVIFSYHPQAFDASKLKYLENDYFAFLHIPSSSSALPVPMAANLYSLKEIPFRYKMAIRHAVDEQAFHLRLERLSKPLYDQVLKSEITIQFKSIEQTFKGETSALLNAIGLFMAVLIYCFILFYGMQVMRGVMEEKSSRISEVIISSVKPFELMMGKILGVALVSILQFFFWICIVSVMALLFNSRYGESIKLFNNANIEQTMKITPDQATALSVHEVVHTLENVDLFLISSVFIYFFIGGYLLYSAFFAAIGAAIDSETDQQQFVFPITLPLFFAFIALPSVSSHPEGTLAFWLSVCPFTSPVIMMVRLSYGIPVSELIISMATLFLSFIISTWLAAKIYHTGILLYGKKISYKDLIAWILKPGR
jgi:ABC-2 type transport system permease protein